MLQASVHVEAGLRPSEETFLRLPEKLELSEMVRLTAGQSPQEGFTVAVQDDCQ